MNQSARRGGRRRRVWLILAALIAGWLVVDKAASVVAPPARVGHWRSAAGEQVYRAAYDKAMATLPRATRIHDVRTRYGTARVYEWAASPDTPQGRLPVVLLPGIRSGVPMWEGNLRHWLGQRTIYAMDAIGDAGLSTQSVPFDSFDEQTDWVEDALANLGLAQVHVVGHSFGGATAATYALRHPQRVASVTLLEPVMVLHGLPASTYLWASLLMLPVPQAWKDKALAEIGGVSVAEVRERTPMSAMVDAGATHYSSTVLNPRTLTDQEWRSLSMPVRVDLASDKSLAGGAGAATRARSLELDLMTVWPNTTHSLPMQAAEPLGTELPAWWSAHE